MKRLWSLLLLTALLLCACSDGGEFGADSSDSTASAVSAASDIAKEESDLFTDRDYDDSYDESGSVHITLSGDSASADSDARPYFRNNGQDHRGSDLCDFRHLGRRHACR